MAFDMLIKGIHFHMAIRYAIMRNNMATISICIIMATVFDMLIKRNNMATVFDMLIKRNNMATVFPCLNIHFHMAIRYAYKEE